jgi:hypothetical protein
MAAVGRQGLGSAGITDREALTLEAVKPSNWAST